MAASLVLHTYESWWLLWLALPLLSSRSLLCEDFVSGVFAHMHSFSYSQAPWCAVLSEPLPGENVYLALFLVPLAHVFVAEVGAPSWPCTHCQLTLQKVPWNASRIHPADMTEPAQASLSPDANHACHARLLQHFHVCNPVLPADMEDVTQAF